MLAFGASSYVLGALLWATDQSACEVVRPLNLHAWWHLLTGIGTYCWIEFAAAVEFERSRRSWADVGLLGRFGLPFGDVLPFVSRDGKL